MVENIRESFLRDTKEVRLDFPRQASNLRLRFEFDVDAAPLHKVFDVSTQTSLETEFIEHQRVKQMRKGEDLFQALPAQRITLRKYGFDCGRTGSTSLQTCEMESDRGDVLGCHFVKLGRDPPPLFILPFKNISRKAWFPQLSRPSLEAGTLNHLP